MTPAITTTGLTKRYRGVVALDDLTLEVPPGSLFGFLGPNGAGKTTALKILAGLIGATDGSATVDGAPVALQGEHRTRVSYLAQEPRFYDWMTGRETLGYVAGLYPAPTSARQIAELLDLVGLAEAADRPTKTYSGGMRQRLGIAQGLVGGAPVVLLDEPAAALDPLGRHDVLELLGRLRGNRTVFFSTHILDDVQRVCDHVAILDRGRLIVSAPTEDLIGRTSTDTVRVALLGATDTTTESLASIPGVARVRPTGQAGDEWRFDLTTRPGAAETVQREVMRLAAGSGWVVTSNRLEALDLESVFLRIVNEERAA